MVRHNLLDDYDAACQVSVLHGQRKWCWQCYDGYVLLERGHEESVCVAQDQCNMLGGPAMKAVLARRYCAHQCDPTCDSCNAATPGACLSCANDLVLSGSVCSCASADGYAGAVGRTLECRAAQNVGNTIVGSYYSEAPIASNTSAVVSFPKAFTTLPRVLIAITSVAVEGDQKFRVAVTQPSQSSFMLSVLLWGST